MNFLGPSALLLVWQLVMFALMGLGIFTLIKFVIVLFKADRAIDEVREYIRRHS